MRKKVEDYELFPESEGTENQIILWNKWRDKWKHKNKELLDIDASAALGNLQNYMDDKRRRKLKQVDDRIEYNEFEAAGKLNELDEDNFFHPKNQVGGASYDSVETEVKNGGMKINSDFIIDFGKEPNGPSRCHESRYPGGDCTSDIWL